MHQASFHFQTQDNFCEEDFIVTASNQDAFQLIQQANIWPGQMLYIYGPPASGKTYLAHLWQKKAGACFYAPEGLSVLLHASQGQNIPAAILDGIERYTDEVPLLHFFNRVKEARGFLLITGQVSPHALNIRLPDLRSRLRALPSVELFPPDDTMLAIMLTKQFSVKQLHVSQEVISFLVPRMERSFGRIKAVVEGIDRVALEQKRNITVPFVKKVLASFGVENAGQEQV